MNSRGRVLNESRCRRRLFGFTITELMVVVAVIGILIGITLPALAGVRRTANEAKSLVNLRSLGQSFANYTVDYGDTYPYGQSGWIIPPWEGTPFAVGFDIWTIERHWPTLLHKTAPWRDHFQSWFSPGTDSARLGGVPGLSGGGDYTSSGYLPSYYYSHSFVADGSVWSNSTSVSNRNIRAIRVSETKYPSAKVMMFDAERNYLWIQRTSSPRPLLMADGSAMTKYDKDAHEPYQNQLSGEPPRIYLDTENGARGRDF